MALQHRIAIDGLSFARNGHDFRVQGVTYGPFAPNASGEFFPSANQVCNDFAQMRSVGVNAVRTYYPPPSWLLDLAEEHEIVVFVDIPWSKHICFLESEQAQREARQAVRQAVECNRDHPSVFAYSIGNEIPTDIVRWHGTHRVERFLAELTDIAKQADPDSLITYSNYPSTEFLDLSFLDFATFNVYLDDREAFRRYLLRLQHLAGDRPLLLGEIGLDTFRHGETEQAEFLAGHLREAVLMGVAGAFVFSWTDDWFTGGFQIEDWAFGITRADRSPKPSYYALGEVFGCSPSAMLPSPIPVSVVVCSYNGGETLEQCLRSLMDLDYPEYEVILVDDGSTDDTRAIAARFPAVRAIHQSNQGLSAARNVGLQAASHPIVAYTDSDCFASRDWLTHLVYQLWHSGAFAVGGPNLTPDDGWLAACVAACPGQPMHVLENDQTAEHIPGCNMAFYRATLAQIQGFDVRYRKAGDDVDLCWRLQQAGMWITFAPGAFVWHHRRQNPRTYLRQQAGYGEAEGLLWFDHPDKFNGRGQSRWRGVLYGASSQGLRIGKAITFRGVFGTGLFQTVYQPGVAHWATLPSTLEWHVGAVLAGLAGPFWGIPACATFGGMISLSLMTAVLQAMMAPLPKKVNGFRARCVIAALCYAQPLVRSWWRYRTRLFPPAASKAEFIDPGTESERLPVTGAVNVDYWDEAWRDRTELLHRVTDYLNNRRWSLQMDSGWTDWDLHIYRHAWTFLQVQTAQEDHGSGKRLMRVRYRLQPGTCAKVLGAAGLISTGVALHLHTTATDITAGVLLLSCGAIWLRGIAFASQVMTAVNSVAREMNLIPCKSTPVVRAQQSKIEKTRSAEI